MVEFNPDGSIKLPERFAKKKSDDEGRMKNVKCMKIKREVTSFSAPKQCKLNITISDAVTDNRFVENIYSYFSRAASVPTLIEKLDEKNFIVTIETDFKRCTDCNSLIRQYHEFLSGNIIEDKGSCTFEGRKSSFSYEDYFD